jgi:predicted Zn finger-like uncharacterized protein
MKFQCDRCKTRYSIADEKVRGKVLKIRCKNCASIITVREGGPSEVKAGHDERAAPARPRAAAVAAPRVTQAPVLARAFEKAMVAPVPDPGGDLDDEIGGEKTTVGETPMPMLVDEWYLSVDGSQDGPFTVAQAQRRVGEMPPGEEMHAWRDGFDDWLPVERVPELASYVKSKPAPRRVGAPPMAAAASAGMSLSKTIAGVGPDARAARTAPTRSALEDINTPLPLSELAAAAAGISTTPKPEENGQQKRPAEFDFVVSEASQMVQLSQLNGALGNTSQAPAVTRTTTGIGHQAIGRGTGASIALPSPAAAIPTATVAALAPPPRKKNSHVGIIVAGSVAAAAILGVLLFLGFRQRVGADDDKNPGASAPGGGSEVIDKFYEGGGLPGSNVPAKPAGDGTAANTPPDKGTQRPRAGIRAPNTTQQPRQPSGKQDLFSGDDEPSQVTVDDILDKGKIANPAMKQCYNRALKNDPMLRLTRMDLRITVGTSGLVTEVRPLSNASQSKILTDCLVGVVKSWRFRKSNEGLTADLPIIFSNG